MRIKKQKLTIFLFVFSLGVIAYSQMTINGNVKDVDGFEIYDASVKVEGTDNEVFTDEEGNYSITVPADQATDGVVSLVISDGITTNTEEVVYEEGATVTQLFELSDVVELEGAVAIGYGTVKKEDLTGAVDLLTEEDFNQGNIVTPENLIQGRSPGVVVNTSGAPGSGSQIRIRGGSSLNASNDPLIVIDGLPITNRNVGGGRSILSSINPNDIESFSILKSASATAIYGSRGSNGVIIITTKKGKKKLRVNYDAMFTLQQVDDLIEVFDANQFRQVITDQGFDFQANRLGNANTNWQEEVLRDVLTQQHNLALSGALGGVLPARLSLGYNLSPGTIITSSFERANVGLNLNPSFFDDHLKINVNANYAYENNRFADDPGGVLRGAALYNPTFPVLDSSSPFGGYFQFFNDDGSFPAGAPGNPVAALAQRRNVTSIDRFYGSVEFDYKLHFFPDVRARVLLGLDNSSGSGSDITDLNAFNNDTQNIGNSAFTSNRINKSIAPTLTYTKSFGDFDLEALAGYEYQEFDETDFTTRNRNNPNEEPERTLPIEVVLVSYLGRINLDYKDKYFLTVNYRRDGSSRFGPENQFGNFPGAAFAWVASKENFLRDSKTISNLKLRLDWGITGQQGYNEGGLFNFWQSNLQGSEINVGYIFGITPINTLLPQALNQGIQWEEARTANIGIDYGFFNNRITGSIDVYEKSVDQLIDFNAPVADGGNFNNTVVQNVGEFEVKGLEFLISADIIKRNKLNWNVTYNFTTFEREIVSLTQNDRIFGGGIGADPTRINRVGEAPGSFYSFQQIYDANGSPIEGAVVDLNGDGMIDSDDQYISGNPDPDFVMGLISNFNYGNFDFTFNLRANIGGDVWNQINSERAQFNLIDNQGFPSNIPTSVLNTNFVAQGAEVVRSDIYIEDGSFLRMDNFTFGYTFKNAIAKTGSVRLWAGMQNVFLITDYSGLDPEVVNNDAPGLDNSFYPRPRTFLFGANFSF